MNKKFIVYFGLIILLAISCVTANLPSKLIPKQNKLVNENGMIIGSISFETKDVKICNRYNFYFENLKGYAWENKKNNFIQIIPSQTIHMDFKPDFFDEDRAVYYFKIEKPAGRYRFYAMKTMREFYDRVEYQTKDIDIPITIEKGKVKYFGELTVNRYNDIRASTKAARDLPKLKKMFPNLEIEN